MDRRIEAFAAAKRMMNALEEKEFERATLASDVMDYCDLPDGMHWNCGASRVVILDDNEDYVLKIAISDEYEKYNQYEVKVYQNAVKEGLEENFAWCACYLEPDEGGEMLGIYVMERLDGDEDRVSDSAWVYGYTHYCKMHNWDDSNFMHASDYNEYRYDTEDEDTLLDYFESFVSDLDIRHKLCRFIADHGLNDFHYGNFLFRGTRLVVCDYAGWGW